MTAPRRRPPAGTSFELFAQAMLDRWLGKRAVAVIERDDGRRNASDLALYLAPADKWPALEHDAMKEVRGRVLDVGGGPGRHSLYLQRKGVRVVAIDPSPTQVALARVRGVREVYQASVSRLPRGLGTFDTILMMGNNLGLAGDVPKMRAFLRDAREITSRRGRIVGHTRMPGTTPEHLPYIRRNVARGRPAGRITLRIRYGGRVGDWFDLLLISPDHLARIAHESGWELAKVIWASGPPDQYVAVLEKA